MPRAIDPDLLRLNLARACAWALLLTGWVALGALALAFTPSVASGFALVSVWLLALGGAAAVGTRGSLRPGMRSFALALAAAATAAGLLASVRGAGLPAVALALLAWAAMTALASGVVRALRLAQAARPRPPTAAAGLGALCAAWVLGDLSDLSALAMRCAVAVVGAALILIWLQRRVDIEARAPGCRAGLFDCSLPAWPAGAWSELLQWPTLLAGLAMLPMMAALPLMVSWCRSAALAPQALVLLHLGAMFVPALLLQRAIASWSVRSLAAVCAALLAAGAAAGLWLAAPWGLLMLAVLHGAAWGLAWSGQLWAPARRGSRGSSPLRAATGYALLTLAFGGVVDRFGADGLVAAHAALGLAALLALAAWPFKLGAKAAVPDEAAPRHAPTAAPPGHRGGGL